jgi:hypothetical protein
MPECLALWIEFLTTVATSVFALFQMERHMIGSYVATADNVA